MTLNAFEGALKGDRLTVRLKREESKGKGKIGTLRVCSEDECDDN